MKSTRVTAAVWAKNHRGASRFANVHRAWRLAMVCGLLSLWGPGCTLSNNFYECTADADCPKTQPFCTPDNICVPDMPIERLCTATYPAKAPAKPIHIGVLTRLTGTPAGQIGDTIRLNSIKIAVDEINDLVSAGNGDPILLHLCDASLTHTDLVNSLNLLAQQLNAVAVIGPTQNQTLLDLAPVATNLKLPLVSPSVTTSSIRDLATQGYAFTMAPLDVQQTDSMYKELITQLGIGGTPQALSGLQLVGISTQDVYGESVRTAFQKSLSNNVANKGLDQPFSYPAADTSQITATEDSVHRLNGVAAIMLMVSNAAETFLRDFNTPGGNYYLDPNAGVKIICSDGCRTDAVLGIAGSALRSGFARVTGVSAVSLFPGSNAALEFLRSYNRTFPDPSQALGLDLYGPYGYDAVYTIGIAAQSISGTPTGAAVAAALAKIKSGTNVQAYPVGRSFYLVAANALNTSNIVLSGVTGPIGFAQTGERDNPQFEGWNVQVNGTNQAIVVGANSCSGGNCDVTCATGYTFCSGLCRDLTSDVNSCGKCGTACAQGQSCCMGACTSGACTNCPMGTNACGRACVSLQTDPNNCGDCGAPCPVPQNGTVTCTNGTCGITCNSPYTACGSACTNTLSDGLNCGKCGKSCGNGTCCNGICVAGTCACPAGQTSCGGVCVNQQTDAMNCGGCGVACTGGQVCCSGFCANGPCPCPAGQTSCSGSCKNLFNDSSNCNMCGMVCGAGKTCCNGSCVTGACTCPSGQTNCSGVCKNINSDPTACGTCTSACPTPQNGVATCMFGNCGITCNTGYTNCGGVCTVTTTDNNNCGQCSNVCTVPGLPVPAGFVNYTLSTQ